MYVLAPKNDNRGHTTVSTVAFDVRCWCTKLALLHRCYDTCCGACCRIGSQPKNHRVKYDLARCDGCDAHIVLELSRKVGDAPVTSWLRDVQAQREDADVEIEVLKNIGSVGASELAQPVKCLADGRRDVLSRQTQLRAMGLIGLTGVPQAGGLGC